MRFVGQGAYPAYLFVGRLMLFVNVLSGYLEFFRSLVRFLRTCLLQPGRIVCLDRYSRPGNPRQTVTVGTEGAVFPLQSD